MGTQRHSIDNKIYGTVAQEKQTFVLVVNNTTRQTDEYSQI